MNIKNIDNIIKESLYENLNKITLNESLSSKLYHFRGANGLLNILETNQFKLSKASGGRDLDLNKGYKYFISFTRSKKTKYTDISTRAFVSRFWIDGDKLNQKYKSISVNYFNDEDYGNVKYTSNLGLYNESEDRLLSNNPTIDNFLQYVTRIDINIEYNNFIDSLVKVCNDDILKHIYVYLNADDFYLGNNKCYNLYENYDKLKDIQIEHNDVKNKLIDSDDFKYDGKIKGIPNMVAVINDEDESNIYNTKENRLISNIWFDDVNDFYHGASIVLKNRKYNFIFPNGKLVSNIWFDYVDNFEEDGYAIIKNNNKFNLLKLNGNIKFRKWYNEIKYHGNGLCIVKVNNKYNIIDSHENLLLDDRYNDINFDDGKSIIVFNNRLFEIDTSCKIKPFKPNSEGITPVYINEKSNFCYEDGRLISKEWFDYASSFHEGFSQVSLNGKFNFINKNGQYLSKQWFQAINEFKNNFARVKSNNKWNLLDINGNLLSNQWFDNISDLNDDIATVNINNKYNFIDKSGNVISNQWFDKADNFKNGIAKVKLDNKYNIIKKNGNLLFNKWIDDIEVYTNGFLNGSVKAIINGEEQLISPKIINNEENINI